MKKIALLLLFLFLCSACSANSGNPSSAGNSSATGNTSASSEKDYSNVTIRLAQQYGMHYAPVYITQKLGLLEKRLPGVNLEWSAQAGGSAMNEALIAGQLDVAFMGLPPMLIAWAKGADYRIASGICVPPAELMIKGDGIESIADLKDTDKIGVPSVGSIQHIMLAMAAEKTLGDAKALDQNIVAMANPDAYTALKSGTDIIGHFSSMPYIDLEIQDGCTSILNAEEAYGQASIICVTTKAFHDDQAEAYSALIAALTEGIELIKAKGDDVIKIIAEVEKISEEDALRYVEWPGTLYDTKVYGAMGLATFMEEQGFSAKCPESVADIMWDNAVAADA